MGDDPATTQMGVAWSREALRRDIARMGVRAGDIVMAHAALRSVGRIAGGGATLVASLLDALGPRGTLVAYTDWDADYFPLLDGDGRLPPEHRDRVSPFDPATSKSTPDNGVFVELVRTWPDALRSGNAGASVAAVGRDAEWVTRDHPLDYGYGPGSPLAKLVERTGKVLLIGAPHDTMTLLHHAEHLADIPGKRVRRYETPLATNGGTVWRMTEEYNTSDPIVHGLPDDYFGMIVRELIATGIAAEGTIGNARSVCADAARAVGHAVQWLELRGGQL